MSFSRETSGLNIFRATWPTARLQTKARPDPTRRNPGAMREGAKNDASGRSSTKYDTWGEMSAKYDGRREILAKDIALVARLTSMGPSSQVEAATISTGEAGKHGFEFKMFLISNSTGPPCRSPRRARSKRRGSTTR